MAGVGAGAGGDDLLVQPVGDLHAGGLLGGEQRVEARLLAGGEQLGAGARGVRRTRESGRRHGHGGLLLEPLAAGVELRPGHGDEPVPDDVTGVAKRCSSTPNTRTPSGRAGSGVASSRHGVPRARPGLRGHPVDVADGLLRARGDRALAAVLAAPGLDLDATSDYGRVMAALDGEHAGLIGSAPPACSSVTALPRDAEDLRRLPRRAPRRLDHSGAPPYPTQASCTKPEYAGIVTT